MLNTVLEFDEFASKADKCMGFQIKQNFISYIAENPEKGDLIPGGGGIRKIRWQSKPSTGKSGGVRIIYYYYNNSMPIFLITVYPKSKKENISQEEKNIMNKLCKRLVLSYEERGKK